jgi:hypothetical protein
VSGHYLLPRQVQYAAEHDLAQRADDAQFDNEVHGYPMLAQLYDQQPLDLDHDQHKQHPGDDNPEVHHRAEHLEYQATQGACDQREQNDPEGNFEHVLRRLQNPPHDTMHTGVGSDDLVHVTAVMIGAPLASSALLGVEVDRLLQAGTRNSPAIQRASVQRRVLERCAPFGDMVSEVVSETLDELTPWAPFWSTRALMALQQPLILVTIAILPAAEDFSCAASHSWFTWPDAIFSKGTTQ